MLMSLDQFVFSISTLAHQELQRQTQWRHANNGRVGARPGRQFVGPGDDTITISGVLVPDLGGKLSSLEELRTMGNKGEAYVLVDGAGTVFGAFNITAMHQTGTHIRADGVPRRVDFSITLERTDDNRANSMAQTKKGDWRDGVTLT